MLLACIVDGKRDDEIGPELGLPAAEVSANVASILNKLV
jgi:hypothetical protein